MADAFRSFVELSPDCFWELNAENIYTYVSPSAQAVLGYSPDEMIGQSPGRFAPDDEAARFRAFTSANDGQPQPFADIEHIRIHKDGHPVVLTSSGTPIFDEAGMFTGYRGLDHDITAQSSDLAELIRITNELAQARSLDHFFLQAVELGRTRLGFDRLSIWLVDGPGWIRGTYGTDEQGDTRYEGQSRIHGTEHTLYVLARETPYILQRDTMLRDHLGNKVATGCNLSAAMWYGNLVSGIMNADTLLGTPPFTSQHGELLASYAASIGHLIPKIQAEVKLRDIRKVMARVDTVAEAPPTEPPNAE